MIRVYTKDGQPLDAERELSIFRSLLSSEHHASKGVVYGMTVKAGTSFNVSKVPGRVFIAGTLIDDDAAEADWMDLDVIEPPGAFDRTFFFYAKFNPATDTELSYGVVHLPSDPVADVINLLNEPSKVIIGTIVVPQAAASAQDAVFSRPDLIWTPERVRRSAIDFSVLNFSAATYETTSSGAEGAGTKTVKWVGMKLSGENLDWQVTVTGATISEAGPGALTYDQSLVIPNWSRGILFIRVAPNTDISAGVTQDQPLRFVGVSSGAQIEDTLSHWFSFDDEFDLTETWPQRLQREDVKIVGYVQDGQISWINGSVTNLGHHSSPTLGDSHNTLSISSSSYATSSTPDKNGDIDLDDVITNLVALNELDLDAAYDKVGVGGGAGKTISVDAGAIDLDIAFSGDEAPEDPFFAGMRANLNADFNSVGAYAAVGFETFNNTPSEVRTGFRYRSIYKNPSDVSAINKAVTLTRVVDDIEISFDTPTDFPLSAFDLDPTGELYIVMFGSGLPGGTDADSKFFRLKNDGGTIKLLTHDRIENIHAVRPNDFGAMAGDISTFVTVYVVHFETDDRFTRTRDIAVLGDASIVGDANILGALSSAGQVTAQNGLAVDAGGALVSAGGITAGTDNIVATTGDIIATAGDISAPAGDIIVDGGNFKASFFNSYRFTAPVDIRESFDFKMVRDSTAWRQGFGHIFSPASLDTVYLVARVPSNVSLKSLTLCSQITDPAGQLTISVNMMRALKTATGASPYTFSSALNATTTPPIVNTLANKGAGLYYRETIDLGPTTSYSDPMWLVLTIGGEYALVGNIIELEYSTSYLQR